MAALACALVLGGCGGSPAAVTAPTPVTQLEREDFVAVVHDLIALEPATTRELRAAKAAWQLVANGLPRRPSADSRLTISAAAQAASAVQLPPLFGEREAAQLTGPGSSPVGQFRTFARLASIGWQMIGSLLDAIEYGSRPAASFASANVALYIESVYDAHFTLAQIGRQIVAGYERLGGFTVFGWRLTATEVNRLASLYSEAAARLHPHVGVRLGA